MEKQITPIAVAMTKTALVGHLAEQCGLSRGEVARVLDSLGDTMQAHLVQGGAGVFTLPGVLKLAAVDKPATPARQGRNPLTGEMTTFKAKPASRAVKARVLKRLKDAVA